MIRAPASIADRIALLVATAGGAGYSPVAPGTVGSAVAVLILWVIPFSVAGRLLFFLVVVLVGTWAAHHTERLVGRKDPGIIVIDEVAGMTLSVLPLPPTPLVLTAGFLLFRLFDIVKPFPAGTSQRLTGGPGVMVDDLIAGVYALVLVWGLASLVGSR